MKIIIATLFLLALAACKSTEPAQSNASSEPPALLFSERGWYWTKSANYILHLEQGGGMRLKLDVNNCFGEYSIESSSLTIGDGMACTERCCDKPIAYELGRDLTQVKSYSLDGETLTLTGPSVELVFELNK